MASWIDALASRSGPLQNAATQFAAEHGLDCDPLPRGVAGFCALRELTQRCGREALDDDAERRFIEGAGAYLGLLLLDQLGDAGAHESRSGSHRLRLGMHGSFDPFASVERVRRAGNVRRAFIDEVALAEAEARGDGPVARVVQEAQRQLEDESGVRVLERFGETLWVDVHGTRVELDLTRVIDVTRGESARTLEGAVRRLCSALRPEAAPVELPWEAARERIFPRLQGRTFVEALPNPERLHLLPLANELWVTLVLRYQERARYVRVDEVETWSKDGAVPQAQALQNLARTYERARFVRRDTPEGTFVIAESRDGLDAARLLLPGAHALLTQELGAPCIVAVPHRDTLLATSATDARGVAALRARVDEAVRRAPHAISRSLFSLCQHGELADFDDSARSM